MIKQNGPSIEYASIFTDDIIRRRATSGRAVSPFRIKIKQSTIYKLSIQHATNNGDGDRNKKRIKYIQCQKF
jgi:hypothetical protein